MFDDLPVECEIERHQDGINVSHFVSKEEGEGNAKKALQRIVELADDERLDYIVVNIGNGGKRDSADFLGSLGFEIIEDEQDHVTAITSFEDVDHSF